MACLMVAMLKAGLNLGRRIEGGRGKVGQVGWLIGRTDTRCAGGYGGFAVSCGSFTRIPFWAILFFFTHTSVTAVYDLIRPLAFFLRVPIL